MNIKNVNKTVLSMNSEELIIHGIQENDVMLNNGSVLNLHGILVGNLHISENSSANIHGILKGNILGTGSVKVFGIINGYISNTLTAEISDGAIINNS